MVDRPVAEGIPDIDCMADIPGMVSEAAVPDIPGISEPPDRVQPQDKVDIP